DIGASCRVGGVVGRSDLLGKDDAGQVFGVHVLMVDRVTDVLPASPDADGIPRIGQDQGEGGPPRSGAHDGDLSHRVPRFSYGSCGHRWAYVSAAHRAPVLASG